MNTYVIHNNMTGRDEATVEAKSMQSAKRKAHTACKRHIDWSRFSIRAVQPKRFTISTYTSPNVMLDLFGDELERVSEAGFGARQYVVRTAKTANELQRIVHEKNPMGYCSVSATKGDENV